MQVGHFRAGIRWLAVAGALCLTMALLLPHVASASEAYGHGPVPGWVLPATVPDREAARNGTDGLAYLLYDEQVALDRKPFERHVRMVYRITARGSVEAGGRFEVTFQPEFQRVVLHGVSVIRDGTRLDRSGSIRTELLRREPGLEDGLIDGEQTLSVLIPDVQVGDVVDFDYTLIGFNTVFEGAYFGSFSASYSSPLGSRRVRLRYPADMPLTWSVGHDEYRVEQGTDGDARTVAFVAEGLDGVDVDDNVPGWHDPFGRIELSTHADWPEVAAWAARHFPTDFEDRATATAIASHLKLHEGPRADALQRAIAFVQGEVRYTGLLLGEWTHAAASPDLTLERRFGDCKGKSALLVALLREAGIDAVPVLVNTEQRHALAQRLPSAYAFDHVVVRATLDGEPVWIDPTRAREHGGLDDRSPLPFGLGLPIDANASGLVELAMGAADAPEVDVQQSITLREDGDDRIAGFEVATVYAGSKAEQLADEFATDGPKAIGKRYLEYMRRMYPGMTQAALPEIGERDERGRVRVTERYEWRFSDGELPVLLFQLSDWIPVAPDDERRMPLALDGPRFGKQTVRVHFDGEWDLAAESDEVRNAEFSLVRTARVEDGSFVLHGEWRRFADAIPSVALAERAVELQQANDLLEFPLSFNGDADSDIDLDAIGDARAWGWSLLAMALLAGALSLAWAFRARSATAGMLFAPRVTIARVLESPRAGIDVLPVLLAFAVLVAMVEPLPEWAAHGRVDAESIARGGANLLQIPLGAVLAWLGFRVLSRRPGVRPLLLSYTWSLVPTIVLGVAGIVALGGRLSLLAEDSSPESADLVGLIAAGALMIAGGLWSLVALLGAQSRVADCGPGRALAANLLGFLMLLVPLIVVISVIVSLLR